MIIVKIILGILVFLLVFMVWCMCRVSGLTDREFERYWKEQQQKEKTDEELKK